MSLPKKSVTTTRRIKKTAEMLLALLKQKDVEWKAYPFRDCTDEFKQALLELQLSLEKIVELSDNEIIYLYQQKKLK